MILSPGLEIYSESSIYKKKNGQLAVLFFSIKMKPFSGTRSKSRNNQPNFTTCRKTKCRQRITLK